MMEDEPSIMTADSLNIESVVSQFFIEMVEDKLTDFE